MKLIGMRARACLSECHFLLELQALIKKDEAVGALFSKSLKQKIENIIETKKSAIVDLIAKVDSLTDEKSKKYRTVNQTIAGIRTDIMMLIDEIEEQLWQPVIEDGNALQSLNSVTAATTSENTSSSSAHASSSSAQANDDNKALSNETLVKLLHTNIKDYYDNLVSVIRSLKLPKQKSAIKKEFHKVLAELAQDISLIAAYQPHSVRSFLNAKQGLFRDRTLNDLTPILVDYNQQLLSTFERVFALCRIVSKSYIYRLYELLPDAFITTPTKNFSAATWLKSINELADKTHSEMMNARAAQCGNDINALSDEARNDIEKKLPSKQQLAENLKALPTHTLYFALNSIKKRRGHISSEPNNVRNEQIKTLGNISPHEQALCLKAFNLFMLLGEIGQSLGKYDLDLRKEVQELKLAPEQRANSETRSNKETILQKCKTVVEEIIAIISSLSEDSRYGLTKILHDDDITTLGKRILVVYFPEYAKTCYQGDLAFRKTPPESASSKVVARM